jgi:hypothetical protein
LPDANELARELADTMAGAFLPGVTSANLAQTAQFYQYSVFDRGALYEKLHDRFEVRPQDTAPGRVAAMLADMPCAGPMFMLTTNYDSFIERAFAERNRPLCVITQRMRDPEKGAAQINLVLPNGQVEQDEAINFQWHDRDRFPADDTTFLFKMHGSVRRKNVDGMDDVIITEDDYVDFMVNAGGIASPFFPPTSLAAAYKQRRFLFLGYSLQDWNFRAFLRLLALRNALSGKDAKRHWAIQKDPAPLESELWRHRNVIVFDGDLNDFCDKLEPYLHAGKAP